ncbi:sugar phosphate isomerase/epimerase family protein [Bythopirellula polymerisocia]|uniref:Xylose isomerase-like TIM barrel n=1 Tax=Bythopirellula polymerisocia TaxID=2528003 RepID=A0A5C6CMF4_9BACT|nr:sugar phosphate isomerase/epimerase family protein [Bythopirellula polymerisocia]TWU26113.1 Xylose isomerase-like TIM barrel [Bythopirellula polymerisocia]
MTTFRIAAQTRCFAQSFKKALHTAASIGCDGVQFDARSELLPSDISDTGLRQLRKMLDDLNLRVGSLAFPTRRGYSDLADLDRRVSATLDAMRLASSLQARVLVCNLGRLPVNPESSDWGTLADVIGTLTTHGMRLGVQLAARAGFDSCVQLADFVGSFPEGTLSLDLHPVNLMAEGHSPTEFVSALGQHIAHVHAVDSVRDFSADRNIEVELGRGSADFPALLGNLEEFEYRGWVTIERNGSAQTVEDFANAVKFLRSLG